MMHDSFIRLASLRGKREPRLISRTLVYMMCLTLVLTGVMPPGVGLAQLTTAQVFSLPEVPVPGGAKATDTPATAAVIPVVAGVSPKSDNISNAAPLNFQELVAAGIVKNQDALIRLGKALFWDMQVGSDGIQACASCHFNAGADIRTKNSVSPGLKDTNFVGTPLGGDNSFGNSCVPYTANDPNNPEGPIQPPNPNLCVPGRPNLKPNCVLKATDFPLNDWFTPTALVPRGVGVTLFQEMTNVSGDTNDVISSQGVRWTQFNDGFTAGKPYSITPGQAVEKGTPKPDIFNTKTPGQLNALNKQRRVEPRNAPTVINAAFNFDNFWDGRASFVFNGANPFGFRDQDATLFRDNAGTLEEVYLRVLNSSLASQAVGPPGSPFEMSFDGRAWPDIGKKMVSLRPLAKQTVSKTDSVLGPVARAGKGLTFATYTDMVKAAFQDAWWSNTTTIFERQAGGAFIQTNPVPVPTKLSFKQFNQMMYNFSMFFGLAVQAYEATLISDQTPFDKFMGAPSLGIPADPTAFDQIKPTDPNYGSQVLLGLSIFVNTGPFTAQCSTCHVPPITTGATVLDYQPDAQGVPTVGGDFAAIETMVMADGTTANYDHGMYNVGTRRTTEDICRAGTGGSINPLTGQQYPLSLTELATLKVATPTQLPADVGLFIPDMPVVDRPVTRGAFKAPNLRNAKFTGPYFHTGDSATLRQVVEFYTRGGNFPNTNLADLTVDINGIPDLQFPEFDPVAQENIEGLVAFLADGFTDLRVAREQAPFDHPQLQIPNGSPSNSATADSMGNIAACGAAGHTFSIKTFLNLDPQKP